MRVIDRGVKRAIEWAGGPEWRASACILFLLIVLSLPGCTVEAASLGNLGCRKIGKEVVINEPGCELLAVKVNACSGFCQSMSFFHPTQNKHRYEQSTCCRMTDMEEFVVELQCSHGAKIAKIPSAGGCSCNECVNDLSHVAASLFRA